MLRFTFAVVMGAGLASAQTTQLAMPSQQDYFDVLDSGFEMSGGHQKIVRRLIETAPVPETVDTKILDSVAEMAEKYIAPKFEDLVRQNLGTAGVFDGLEFKIKGKSRNEKMMRWCNKTAPDCGITPLCLPDVLRYTVRVSDLSQYSATVLKVRAAVLAQGALLIAENNYWTPGNYYHAVNDVYAWNVPYAEFNLHKDLVLARLARVEEQSCMPGKDLPVADAAKKEFFARIEIQYHTDCSFSMNNDATHEAYEIIREGTGLFTTCEKNQASIDRANNYYWNWCNRVPPGIEQVGTLRSYLNQDEKAFGYPSNASIKSCNLKRVVDEMPFDAVDKFCKNEMVTCGLACEKCGASGENVDAQIPSSTGAGNAGDAGDVSSTTSAAFTTVPGTIGAASFVLLLLLCSASPLKSRCDLGF